MNTVVIDLFRQAVEQRHRCKASYKTSERVRETNVHTFALTGHATAHECFVWSASIGETHDIRVYAFLRLGATRSPGDAFRRSLPPSDA